MSLHYQCRHPIPSLLDTTFFFFFLETGAHCVILTGLEPAKSFLSASQVLGLRLCVMVPLSDLSQKVIYNVWF